jgi:hypothetical protein
MYKKFLLSIVIVMPLLALGYAIFGNQPTASTSQTKTESSLKSVYPSRTPANVPQTKLKFIPKPLHIAADGTVEAEVFMDAYENQITSVKVEIGYDPKIFKVVSVKGVDFLGGKKVTVNTIDEVNGKITFGASVDLANTRPLMGSDAIIKVVLRPTSRTVPQSELTFLPGTHIAAQGIADNAVVSTENAAVDLTAMANK